MKIKIFRTSINEIDLENQINKWLWSNSSVKIQSQSLSVINMHDNYEDGRIFNQWNEYFLTILYK